jgi:hypothetical protein
MDQHFDEGVAGAGLAVFFAAAGAGVLNLLPMEAAHTGSVLAVSTFLLACIGGAVGVRLVRMAKRRPADGHRADYSDTPPAGRGPVAR